MIEWDEQKQVSKYSAHAPIIVRNVISVLNKKQPPALYQGTYEMISIANGKVSSSFFFKKSVRMLNFCLAWWIYLLECVLGALVWGFRVFTLEIEGPLSYLDTEKYGLAIVKYPLLAHIITLI